MILTFCPTEIAMHLILIYVSAIDSIRSLNEQSLRSITPQHVLQQLFVDGIFWHKLKK